jgi:hypothetical protein
VAKLDLTTKEGRAALFDGLTKPSPVVEEDMPPPPSQEGDRAVFAAWRYAHLASARANYLDNRRMYASQVLGRDLGLRFLCRQAEEARDAAFKALVNTPATSLEAHNRKRDKVIGHSIVWLRKYRPELAAVIDAEHDRLTAEKRARQAARAAKKQEGL